MFSWATEISLGTFQFKTSFCQPQTNHISTKRLQREVPA